MGSRCDARPAAKLGMSLHHVRPPSLCPIAASRKPTWRVGADSRSSVQWSLGLDRRTMGPVDLNVPPSRVQQCRQGHPPRFSRPIPNRLARKACLHRKVSGTIHRPKCPAHLRGPHMTLNRQSHPTTRTLICTQTAWIRRSSRRDRPCATSFAGLQSFVSLLVRKQRGLPFIDHNKVPYVGWVGPTGPADQVPRRNLDPDRNGRVSCVRTPSSGLSEAKGSASFVM